MNLLSICPKLLCHDTKMTSMREPRETNCPSLNGPASKGHIKEWNSEGDDRFPSKFPTMKDEPKTARKVYDRGKTHWYDEATSKLDEICKAKTTPEGKWFCHPRTKGDTKKRAVSRRVCDSEHF